MHTEVNSKAVNTKISQIIIECCNLLTEQLELLHSRIVLVMPLDAHGLICVY